MKTPAIINKVLTDYFRYVSAAVVMIVFLAGYLQILAPKLLDLQTGKVKVQQKSELDLAVKKEESIALKKSNDAFDLALPIAQRRVINEFLPSEADFPSLMLTIQSIVAASQMTLASISVGTGGQIASTAGAATPTANAKAGSPPNAKAATVSGVSVQTQDTTINVTGGTTYESFKTLLANIESSRRLFDVVSVGFSTSTPDSTTTVATSTNSWSLVLRSYYLPSK